MSAANAIRLLVMPLLLDWKFQFGMWVDSSPPDLNQKFAVLRPMGGFPGDLVRKPTFKLFLIGKAKDLQEPGDKAELIINAAKNNSGGLVFIEIGEPSFYTTAALLLSCPSTPSSIYKEPKMGAFVGRDVVVEFAIADEATKPATSAYKVLGMMRDKNIGASWDTADTTADKSPDFTRTSLVTFKQVTFSGGGVSYTDEAFNQDEFEKHVVEPPAATGHQPKVWLRVTYPSGKIYEGPFIVNQFDSSAPYADAATWTINAQSNGAVTLTLPTTP